jgi:hypothetical protein
MVVALLEGRKTQTRRLASSPLARVEIGDLLYVRESIWQSTADPTPDMPPPTKWSDEVEYMATGRDPLGAYWKSRPSIHMPRRFSRVTLEVVDKRFQRLGEISDEDAVAEGLRFCHGSAKYGRYYTVSDNEIAKPAKQTFFNLWDSLHDKEGERARDNPEIVALTFKVHRTNVDQMETPNAES